MEDNTDTGTLAMLWLPENQELCREIVVKREGCEVLKPLP